MRQMTQIGGLPNEAKPIELTKEAAALMLPTRLSDLVDRVFMAAIAQEGLQSVRHARWQTTNYPEPWKLDAELVASQRLAGGSVEILYRTPFGLGSLGSHEKSVVVESAGRTPADALAVENWFRQRLPEHVEEEKWNGSVISRVIWRGAHGCREEYASSVETQRFADIERNYAESTRNALAELTELRPPLRDGRLMIFHGEPGTGKSHAITSLAAEWREWADLLMISDPERLLTDPAYLLDLIKVEPIRNPHVKAKDIGRWQVLVLEDSGELLAPTAKAETGQGLSRLLNITDGIVGRGSRSLILITTNEHISNLHPAVSRPGRCMAEVEFAPLSGSEIDAWCDAHDMEVPDREEMTLAELYAAQRSGRVIVKQQAKIGFA